MQNIIYIHNEHGRNKIERIYYEDIFSGIISPVPYSKKTYINFILTSYEHSLFDIKIDLFCTFKDNVYLFSFSKMELKSDEIVDFSKFKRELTSYLRVYFDIKTKLIRTPTQNLEFCFKHNLDVSLKSYKESSILKRTLEFYRKYGEGGLWSVEIHDSLSKINNSKLFRLRLLDDYLKILTSLHDLNDRTFFFLCSLSILPLDLILHVINIVVPRDSDKKIYFYYKLYQSMCRRGNFNLGYLYLLEVVMELKHSLSIKMAEYFIEQSKTLLKNNNWKLILENVINTLELDNRNTYGGTIWDNLNQELKPNGIEEFHIQSGNHLSGGCSMKIFNLRRDFNCFVDRIELKISLKSSLELSEMVCEIESRSGNILDTIKSHVRIPICKKISNNMNILSVPVDLSQHLRKDLIEDDKSRIYLHIKELKIKHHQSLFLNSTFQYIPRKNQLIINEVFYDENFEIFSVKSENDGRIFSDQIEKLEETHLIFFERGKKKVLFHEISKSFVEKHEFL